MNSDDLLDMAGDPCFISGIYNYCDRDVLAELPAGSDPAPVIDALEVIRWFQFMISVKIQRALGSRAHEAENPEFWAKVPKDSDGTAKIALIAIDPLYRLLGYAVAGVSRAPKRHPGDPGSALPPAR
jgi:hypothetical protein